MLNFTAGAANLKLASRPLEVRVVLTSRAFVERAKLDSLIEALGHTVNIVYLDDIRAEIALKDKIRGVLRGSTPQARAAASDPAVILFTSGLGRHAQGRRAVAPQHHRQCAQALARVDADSHRQGVQRPAGFPFLRPHRRPDHAAAGGRSGVSLPLAAALPHRARTHLHDQVHHPVRHRHVPGRLCPLRPPLRLPLAAPLVAGAEPVRPQTRTLYMEQFGVRILEGYGVTEAAPVAAMNTPMTNRPGTVGRLSPLMEARLEPVEGVDEGGRLYLAAPTSCSAI
jgi:acyl-[acyl-carrier-protein]-phospholipid O-acyltransferase / long-chain-fatty-acid--[acyl-carrier-protein] ligase